MNYYNAILATFPGITADDFTLEDHGDGVTIIARWDYEGAPQPNLDDLSSLADQYEQLNVLNKELNQNIAVLSATDWAIIRKMDTNQDVPADIVTARSQARTRIDEIQAEIAALNL